jgi:hypothetical protein
MGCRNLTSIRAAAHSNFYSHYGHLTRGGQNGVFGCAMVGRLVAVSNVMTTARNSSVFFTTKLLVEA